MKQKTVSDIVSESVQVHEAILRDENLLKEIDWISKVLTKVFRNKKKALLCGNGGSAADAQHIAAELSGKFMLNRAPLYAEALHVNTSYLTATANDFSFEEVYARLVQAQGVKGDILIGISTSGNSMNVVNALVEAKKKGMISIGMTGTRKSKMEKHCDYLLRAPSANTPRIQEAHILMGHILCELVERELFG
ncbi:MAG: SIS domain-containing protein [Chitinophagales bacterium]|nr:SIS domain-containing protein [Chitinophagales bacterium]